MLINVIYKITDREPPKVVDCRLWRQSLMAAVRGTVVTSDEDCWINSLKKEIHQSDQDLRSIEQKIPAQSSMIDKNFRGIATSRGI